MTPPLPTTRPGNVPPRTACVQYEVPPCFPPTYKFDKGVPAADGIGGGGHLLLPYDSSKKRRIPAWTDRVLWRGSVPSPGVAAGVAAVTHEEDVVVGPVGSGAYQACMEVRGRGGGRRGGLPQTDPDMTLLPPAV